MIVGRSGFGRRLLDGGLEDIRKSNALHGSVVHAEMQLGQSRFVFADHADIAVRREAEISLLTVDEQTDTIHVGGKHSEDDGACTALSLGWVVVGRNGRWDFVQVGTADASFNWKPLERPGVRVDSAELGIAKSSWVELAVVRIHLAKLTIPELALDAAGFRAGQAGLRAVDANRPRKGSRCEIVGRHRDACPIAVRHVRHRGDRCGLFNRYQRRRDSEACQPGPANHADGAGNHRQDARASQHGFGALWEWSEKTPGSETHAAPAHSV